MINKTQCFNLKNSKMFFFCWLIFFFWWFLQDVMCRWQESKKNIQVLFCYLHKIINNVRKKFYSQSPINFFICINFFYTFTPKKIFFYDKEKNIKREKRNKSMRYRLNSSFLKLYSNWNFFLEHCGFSEHLQRITSNNSYKSDSKGFL